MKMDPNYFFLFLTLFFSVVFITSIFFKAGIFIFLSIVILVSILIFIFIDLRGRRHTRQKENQLEGFLLDLMTSLYVNPNIQVALQQVVEKIGYPLQGDIEKIIDDTRRGSLLNDAMANMVNRNRSSLIHVIITGLIAANEKGADLIGFLKNQIEYLREKKNLTNYIRILSSGPRYTSYLIAVIPVIAIIAASFLNPGFASGLVSGSGLSGISLFIA